MQLKSNIVNEEKAMEEWSNISKYIWNRLEEEWPNFNDDCLDDLGFFVCEERGIMKRPSEFEKEEILEIIESFLAEHRAIDVFLLLEKDDIEKDMEIFWNLGHLTIVSWDLKQFDMNIYMEISPESTDSSNDHYNMLKEKFNYENESIELILSFGNNLGKNHLMEMDYFVEKNSKKL